MQYNIVLGFRIVYVCMKLKYVQLKYEIHILSTYDTVSLQCLHNIWPNW